MNDRKLLQQALDELLHLSDGLDAREIIKAIEARLTYSELEPVGCIKEVHTTTSFGGTATVVPQMYCFLPIGTILYARTNKEIK